MYAVIVSGGKQYRVSKDQTLHIEKLSAEIGDTVAFDKVLMVADGDNIKLGAPYLEGTTVTGTVVAQERAKKIRVIKFKRRKNYLRHIGHRQYYTEVKITGIGV